MNYDAQDAALGLLSLPPGASFIQPFPLLAPNPLKRKQHPQATHMPLGRQAAEPIKRALEAVSGPREGEREAEGQGRCGIRRGGRLSGEHTLYLRFEIRGHSQYSQKTPGISRQRRKSIQANTAPPS